MLKIFCQLKFLKYCGFLIISHIFLYYFLLNIFDIKELQIYYKNNNGSTEYNPSSDKICDKLYIRETNITTSEIFEILEFSRKSFYWDKNFEYRYIKERKYKNSSQFKVILVLHPPNDKKLTKTSTDYFQQHSKYVLTTVLKKMKMNRDMSFIWSEIGTLQQWWQHATPLNREFLKSIIDCGRFEITTGGWVTTDEANVHVYAMIDQLIEGHQWVKNNLNTLPKIGWSISPYGHGATLPYLLSASGIYGTIIHRVHVAWQAFFSVQQNADFYWQPYWQTLNKKDILVHNMLFNSYNFDETCEPFQKVCGRFDSRHNTFYANNKLETKAQVLYKQYSRTASLFRHNVVLIPIECDFHFSSDYEIDRKYQNYLEIVNYINDNNATFNTDIFFGTPFDYFQEIKNRTNVFDTLKGDFFVYADLVENRHRYWSGYFTTRPFLKMLCTELEHNLRTTEILYTLAYNFARQNNFNTLIKIYEHDYNSLIEVRRNFSSFQNNGGITGSSSSEVMAEYQINLFRNVKNAIKLQEFLISMLLSNGDYFNNNNFIINDFKNLDKKRKIFFRNNKEKSIIIFNSLAQKRVEIISIRTFSPNKTIILANGRSVPMQINRIYNFNDISNKTKLTLTTTEYEILFLAELPPLALITFRLVKIDKVDNNHLSHIYCEKCIGKTHKILFKTNQSDDIQLENSKMKLIFNKNSGFLESITRTNFDNQSDYRITFGAYNNSATKRRNTEVNILEQYFNQILITKGPLASDVTVRYGPLLNHTVRIFHTNTYLDNAIYLQNDINYRPKTNEKLFMRFVTNIDNGEIPEFYSDQNGFQFQRRKKKSISIEGNYFPITSAAFIQDTVHRLTLLTTYAQAAASLRSGELEIILDRSTKFDENGSVVEPILDNKLIHQKFWLIIEDIKPTNNYQVLSLFANYLGNCIRYPPSVYFVNQKDVNIKQSSFITELYFLQKSFPCNMHLLNARTLTDQHSTMPSNSALIILHKQGYDCNINDNLQFCNRSNVIENEDLFFTNLDIEDIQSTSLTGLYNRERLNNYKKIIMEPMDIQSFNITFK